MKGILFLFSRFKYIYSSNLDFLHLILVLECLTLIFKGFLGFTDFSAFSQLKVIVVVPRESVGANG